MIFTIDDEICIVCHRVADMPTPRVPSDRQRCALCREAIWVSKKLAATPPKVCLQCVKRAAPNGQTMQISSSIVKIIALIQ